MENNDFNCEDCLSEFEKQLNQLKKENEEVFNTYQRYIEESEKDE